MVPSFFLLAQQAGEQPPGSPWQFLLPAATIALLAYFLLFQPQRARERRYRDMVDGIKENDHVVTSGGLHGVVTSINRDQGRVVLRVDEATGAKVRVDLWAIARVGDKPVDTEAKKK